MEEDEPSTFCSNCKKDVTTLNYRIHEIHCRRFIQLCSLCGETVPRAELQAHHETQHRQVQCSLCHKSMEHFRLETHTGEDCVERLLSCRYCELETPCRALAEHEEVCGSRTERCTDCGKYVMYSEQERHGETCLSERSTALGESSEVACEFCTKLFPEDQLLHHQGRCQTLSEMVGRIRLSHCQDPLSPRLRLPAAAFLSPFPPHPLRAPPLSSPWAFAESEDLDEIGCCPVCDCALPIELLEQHQAKCWVFDRQRKLGRGQDPINDTDNF
uniref:XIAP-associated factor 1 n=1 Tax=Pristiophorus japonicus TaxID=55135 RepID=UPI00398E5B0F